MLKDMSFLEALKLFAPIIALEIVLALFCLYRLTRDRVKYFPKLVWALIIIFLQLIGPLSYLLIGRERD